MKSRESIWKILEVATPGDLPSHIFDVFIVVLISLNVVAVIIGTVESLQSLWGRFLHAFEIFSIVVFTLEYIARVWSCTADPRFSGSIKGRLKFVRQPMAVVDLVAFLPFYLPFVGLDLRFVRALRLFRLVRLAKAGRYYSSLSLIGDTLRSSKEELILAFVILFVLLIISSAGIYYCENGAQPERFSSIPSAFWWSVVTLTTVGYGDIYPVTPVGKFFASIIAILGIGMFALPTGILGAGFVEEMRKRRSARSARRCPHCGKELN